MFDCIHKNIDIESCKTINKDIEDITYFNSDIVEAKNYIPFQTITSVEIYRYSPYCQEYLNFEKDLISLNKFLRDGNNNDICMKLSNKIMMSPVLNHEITVYRGLNIQLDVTEGDILNNLGFMFVSLDKECADFFTQDTSECYTEKVDDITKVKKSEYSTLLTITIPKETHMLDLSHYNHMFQIVFSQLLLDKNVKLKINSVEIIDNLSFISCEAIQS
jgi:hypothetical protein